MANPNQYHIIAKPIGPICNLSCEYCFYLEKKKALFPRVKTFHMAPEILETFIRQYIESQDSSEIQFAWQGGEPTLLGVDYFKKIVRLQKKYADGKTIGNGFQTNGLLLDDQWCDFFSENDFLVGLSIDGPAKFHDRYRVDKSGRPTFKRVIHAVDRLKEHQVKFNMMVVVNDHNSRHPMEIYRFLKESGDGFIQFIPVVERVYKTPGDLEVPALSMPPDSGADNHPFKVAPWSVRPDQLARFYISIFNHWIQNDVGSVFIQFFDTALGNWMGVGSGLCQFAPTCGATCAIEHNGNLYNCDHYVYPEYFLGNIMETSLKDLVVSEKQTHFAAQKQENMTRDCLECKVQNLCNGDCPKHRFEKTARGQSGLSYFCPSYKQIFNHMVPYLKKMGRLIRSGRPASEIMTYRKGMRSRALRIKPNNPCPCNSGKKYKKCCGLQKNPSK